MKTHLTSDKIPIEQVAEGVRRQILGYESNLMLVKIYFDKGAIGAPHSHPHQQISYVLKGKFEVEIADKKKNLKEGDSFIVPGDEIHGVVCLEEGILIDSFSPMREDFL